MKILTGRIADDLTALREASADAEYPLELTINPEAIEGLENFLLGIAQSDLDLLTIYSAQLVRGMRQAITDHNHVNLKGENR
ncbi:hypothetical protein C5D98_14950 [Rathayibacter rathayi]|uniref:hypothetical protein n=1 Tax=Rathayibacter rathayi TaxID=33887 RepID=UPI000CE90EEE|nr:hypothetical protein [Rathayibacter rathayi]PPG77479.1 hypothetical protein C5C15_09295 [Rathayibacter rathayi]PPG94315.1 hypothetical protein C5C22_09030 [Rathayibacter rathayi]PPI65247.1 hypothetical protein C5D98_14950 [Rathayibacter rathayi]